MSSGNNSVIIAPLNEWNNKPKPVQLVDATMRAIESWTNLRAKLKRKNESD